MTAFAGAGLKPMPAIPSRTLAEIPVSVSDLIEMRFLRAMTILLVAFANRNSERGSKDWRR
jgi:hypothetical protein